MNSEEFETLSRQRDAVVDRINEFVDHWPNTENGPAHVILSDFNAQDYFINLARLDIEKLLRGEALEVDYRQTQEELLATHAFLQGLMDIPEVQRDVYGDTEWSI